MISTNEVAIRNERRILDIVARAGWLRTVDVAYSCWGQGSDLQMARRTLVRLVEKKYLDVVKGPDGFNVYGITKSGCSHLARYTDREVRPTVKLLDKLGNYEHRCLCNLVAIYHSKNSACTVYYEHEIQSGLLPFNNIPCLYNKYKLPDYFVIDPVEGSIWGEIERSKRSAKDRDFLVNWLITTFDGVPELPELGANCYLRQVEFIAPREFETKLVAWVARAYANQGIQPTDAFAKAEDLCGYWTIVRGY